jgi:hypothetical protein
MEGRRSNACHDYDTSSQNLSSDATLLEKRKGYGEVMEELKRRKYLREEQFYCLLIVYLVFASYLLGLQMTSSPLFIAFKGEF